MSETRMREKAIPLPDMKCRECGRTGHMRLWSTKPHSLNEERLRWPIVCLHCDTMALSSHRIVSRAVAAHTSYSHDSR